MADQLDHDFWDRLILDPLSPASAQTADDRAILAIDALFPGPSPASVRERARSRVIESMGSPQGSSTAPDVALLLPMRSRANSREEAANRVPRHWALVAAAVILVVFSAIAGWWSSGNKSLPFRTRPDDSGVISAVSEQTGNVPMQGIDPGRTNMSSQLGTLSDPAKVWEYRAKGQVRTPPLFVDGVVYFGQSANSPADPGAILAVRAGDGSLIWSYPTRHGLKTAFLVDRGILYAVDDAGIIYAIDSRTGVERWSMALHDEQPYALTWYGAPLLLDDTLVFSSGSSLTVAGGKGAVFVGRPAENWIEGNPHVYAISPADGSLIWDVPGFPGDEPASLIALSIDDGSLLWSHAGSPAFLGPSFADGTVYYGEAEPTALVALDAQTGAERWRSVLAEGTLWDGVSSPAITSDSILAVFTSGILVALDKQTGHRDWSTQVLFSGYDMQSGATVAGDQAIVIGDGAIAAVDLISRKVAWHKTLGCYFTMSMMPIRAGGVVFQIAVTDNSDGADCGSVLALADASDSS